MQACRAYYNEGHFVPLGFGRLPEGTQAIITLLDDAPHDTAKKLMDFDYLCEAVRASADEEMPVIERVNFADRVKI